MIESKSIETPATLVRFSIRAQQGAASVGSAGGRFTNPYHEESDRSKRVSFKTLGWRTVPSTLDTVESRVAEAKREKKQGASKNDKKCSDLYIRRDETRFQHKLKKGVFDGPCYQDSQKNNGNRPENLDRKCSDLYIRRDRKKKRG